MQSSPLSEAKNICREVAKVAIETVTNTIKTAYSDRPELKLASIDTLPDGHTVRVVNGDAKRTEVFVNPHTADILGDRVWDNTAIGIVFQLHYAL